MKITPVIFSALLIVGSCIAGDTPDAIKKLSKIPLPKHSYGLRHWENPELLVTAKGVLISGTKKWISYDDVLQALAELPSTAWPYGRVIAMSAFPGLSGIPDSPNITKRIEALLKSANIEIVYEPSA
jgi:hypothetical protein